MNKKTILIIYGLLICVTAIGKEKEKEYSFTHPWSGKRIAYIGDSVSDPEVKKGDNMKHYWDFLQEWLNTEPLVYATNGHTLQNGLSSIDKLYEEHGQEVDVIVVFLGTNDYNASLPLGSLYIEQESETERSFGNQSYKQYAVRRTFSFSDKTIFGRINLVMQKLKTLYPTKQIVFLTPLHRGFAEFGSFNIQLDESYQNTRGLYIDDVVNAIIEAGRAWSVPVIDLFAISGLSPTLPEYKSFFFDAEHDCLHPNESGHERIARTLLYQTLVIPVF